MNEFQKDEKTEIASNKQRASSSQNISSKSRHVKLTQCDVEILRLLRASKSNSELEEALHLTKRGVESRLTRLYAKLEVKSRIEAALWAERHSVE